LIYFSESHSIDASTEFIKLLQADFLTNIAMGNSENNGDESNGDNDEAEGRNFQFGNSKCA